MEIRHDIPPEQWEAILRGFAAIKVDPYIAFWIYFDEDIPGKIVGRFIDGSGNSIGFDLSIETTQILIDEGFIYATVEDASFSVVEVEQEGLINFARQQLGMAPLPSQPSADDAEPS